MIYDKIYIQKDEENIVSAVDTQIVVATIARQLSYILAKK